MPTSAKQLTERGGYRMRPKPRLWTKEDEEFLRRYYEIRVCSYCAKKLNRTESAIRHKASRLGILRRGAGRTARILENIGYLYVSSLDMKEPLHRLVMEYKLGRKLDSDEVVHHIDGNPLNNHPDNLSLESVSSHMKIHDKDRERNELGQYT